MKTHDTKCCDTKSCDTRPGDAAPFRNFSPDELEVLAAAEWAQAAVLTGGPKGLVMQSATQMHARAKLKRILMSEVPTKH
jgi:hypothetical protein